MTEFPEHGGGVGNQALIWGIASLTLGLVTVTSCQFIAPVVLLVSLVAVTRGRQAMTDAVDSTDHTMGTLALIFGALGAVSGAVGTILTLLSCCGVSLYVGFIGAALLALSAV